MQSRHIERHQAKQTDTNHDAQWPSRPVATPTTISEAAPSWATLYHRAQHGHRLIAPPTTQTSSSDTLQRQYVPTDDRKVTVQKICSMRNSWYKAAVNVILERKLQAQGRIRAKLNPLEANYRAADTIPTQHPRTGQPLAPTDYVSPGDYQSFFDKDLPYQLAEEIGKATGEQPYHIRKELGIAFIRLANADTDSWDTITANMQEPGTNNYVLSTQTPVNEAFHATYSATHGVVGKQYGKTGISSMNERLPADRRTDQESNRPANLWYSELHESNAEANRGEKLFSAFRSGGFSAYNEAPNKRKDANLKRALGVVEAMVLQTLMQMQQTDQDNGTDTISGYLMGHTALPIKVAAIDLLADTSGVKGDAPMVADHHEALQALDGTTRIFTIKWPRADGHLEEKTVKAKLDILGFNVSVNQFSTFVRQGKQQATNQDPLGKLWQAVQQTHEMNRKKKMDIEGALLVLQEDIKKANQADAKIDSSLTGNLKLYRDEIQEITLKDEQINNLFAEISKTNLGEKGSYRVPALIANLANMLGYMVHFNCKSGKDRTGLMDIESKVLARELTERRKRRKSSDIPAEDLDISELRDKHQQMLWESGSLQILERNTRGQSLKVADLKGIPGSSDRELMKRLGGEQILNDLRGLAEYTTLVDKMLAPPSKGEKFKGFFS